MADKHRSWARQREAFWRTSRSVEAERVESAAVYCEAEWILLKAFGNWRAQFKAEPQVLERKLLYRRRPLSPPPKSAR